MPMLKRIMVAAVLLLVAQGAWSAPRALVEDVQGAITGIEMLDFVSDGQTIDLGSEGKLTLGYMESCVREVISGGKVKIGTAQSEVQNGSVQRSTTQCGGTRLALAADQAMQSGAVAVRDISLNPEPSLTVHDVSPLFLFSKGGRVVIKRIDQTGERHKIVVPKVESDMATLDLAERDLSLQPGGRYMVTAGGKMLVFDVAADASSGGTVLQRITPF